MNVDDYLSIEVSLAVQAQKLGRDQNKMVKQMRNIAQGTVASYMRTNYIVNFNGNDILLKVMHEIPPTLLAILNSYNVTSCAIITVYNPCSKNLNELENRRRQKQLKDLLCMHDYLIVSAKGKSCDDSWEEPSFLVLGISYELASSFGACFQQNAIIYNEIGSPVELAFCNAP